MAGYSHRFKAGAAFQADTKVFPSGTTSTFLYGPLGAGLLSEKAAPAKSARRFSHYWAIFLSYSNQLWRYEFKSYLSLSSYISFYTK